MTMPIAAHGGRRGGAATVPAIGPDRGDEGAPHHHQQPAGGLVTMGKFMRDVDASVALLLDALYDVEDFALFLDRERRRPLVMPDRARARAQRRGAERDATPRRARKSARRRVDHDDSAASGRRSAKEIIRDAVRRAKVDQAAQVRDRPVYKHAA